MQWQCNGHNDSMPNTGSTQLINEKNKFKVIFNYNFKMFKIYIVHIYIHIYEIFRLHKGFSLIFLRLYVCFVFHVLLQDMLHGKPLRKGFIFHLWEWTINGTYHQYLLTTTHPIFFRGTTCGNQVWSCECFGIFIPLARVCNNNQKQIGTPKPEL
jgi:hypothetical protein